MIPLVSPHRPEHPRWHLVTRVRRHGYFTRRFGQPFVGLVRESDRARIDGETPSNLMMVPVREFPGSSETISLSSTSLSLSWVSKIQKLPLELLAYCIMVHPYHVSELLEVVLGPSLKYYLALRNIQYSIGLALMRQRHHLRLPDVSARRSVSLIMSQINISQTSDSGRADAASGSTFNLGSTLPSDPLGMHGKHTVHIEYIPLAVPMGVGIYNANQSDPANAETRFSKLANYGI